jgi:hemerythrin-like metal-binding protein
MAFAEWDRSLATGSPKIDAQHKRLFIMLSELHDAIVDGNDAELLDGVIAGLQSYAAEHFREEEALMAEVEYPLTRSHMAIHEHLERQTDEMAEKYRSGEYTISISLAMFMRDWLIEHIGEHDRLLAEHIRAAYPDLVVMRDLGA